MLSSSLCASASSSSSDHGQLQFVDALKRCRKMSDLEWGRKIHRDAIAAGFHKNRYVAAGLIAMYSKCRRIALARAVFDEMVDKDVVAWTSLILGYVENGESSVALDLFSEMDCEPDSVTYIAVLKACGCLASMKGSKKQIYLEKGIVFHMKIRDRRHRRDRGFESDVALTNTLVDMYSKCGSIGRAKAVFDAAVTRSIVTWNCLILGYVQNGQSSAALDLFDRVDCKPDSVTFVAALKACGALARERECDKQSCLEKGMRIHKRIKDGGFDSDVAVANTLLDMYCKCGSMSAAKEVFDRIVRRDVVTWNCLIMGYAENGQSSLALDLFIAMTNIDHCEPDLFTCVAALKACVNLGAVPIGREIHCRVCKLGMEDDLIVVNALIDFYGKCGRIARVEELFNGMRSPDMFSWNCLIAGYSSRGDSAAVFSLVGEMREADLQLDCVTFTCVLAACSHAGLVKEAKVCFESMAAYGVDPNLEHYNCMVDVLGRANRLEEAFSLVMSMPFDADEVTWTILLGACRKWKNLDLGIVAFEKLVGFEGQRTKACMLMSDIYRSLNLWQDLERLQ